MLGLSLNLISVTQPNTTLALLLVSIIGGILLIKGKSIGGILPLIAGIILLLGLIITLGDITGSEMQCYDCKLTANFFVDPIIMVVGGILGIIKSS